MDYATLGVKVEALEGDFREVKDSIAGLDAKIDKAISSLAHEVRAAITSLSGQFAERQRTPWGVLISAAGFIVLVLGGFGSQAISPILSDVKSVKDHMVPREEISFRAEVINRRISAIESDVARLERQKYEEMREELHDLKQHPRPN